MKLIINHSSMQPIYEQIVEQIKGKIMQGELKEDTALPSVRALAKELKVSALTVKKAYDALTEEGFIITIHGKGSFVAFANQNVMLEEKRKEVETDLEMAIRKGRSCGKMCIRDRITKIDHAFDADTYFPNLDEDEEWEMTKISEEQTCFDLEYYFTVYERVSKK